MRRGMQAKISDPEKHLQLDTVALRAPPNRNTVEPTPVLNILLLHDATTCLPHVDFQAQYL